MLALEDDWVWDSWIADDGELYHLFFLQAPKSLGDPGGRHTAARIGHATSTDLTSWAYHGIALGPGAPGSWDDLALWTGSTVRGDDGVWRMYYTAINSSGRTVKDQRIGLAESDDLFTWRRVGDRPILMADPRWYMTLGETEDPNVSETWRDPYVFRDPDGDGWHMLICARQPAVPRFDDGVIGHARSADGVSWHLAPPLSEPAGFGQIEVAQPNMVQGQPTLVFTCHPQEQAQVTKDRFGEFCYWSVPGDSLVGPWDLTRARPFEAEPDLFAGPLVQDRSGNWVLIGFLCLEPKGVNSFDILDPIPVELHDGAIQAKPGYAPRGEVLLGERDRATP
jgi:sucrose-6-phosphate hydrolase SacC (GH32 family)